MSPLPGYAGYFFYSKPATVVPQNSFLLEPALAFLASGDVVKIDPLQRFVRVLYRKSSRHNAILLTERCNNFCLMCSQPPREIDDSYIVHDALEAIPLMSQETREVTLTGGEPTLLGKNLGRIVRVLPVRITAMTGGGAGALE